MADILTPDLCVIGAGSGGLSVAAGASQMGARVVLIEKGKMGGDCLNYGCVPSKSLIAAAHAADAMRRGDRFGVRGHEPEVDFSKVHDHVKSVIAAIAPNDSVERFESFGVTVIQAEGRFVGANQVEAGGQRIQARRIVIATGSSPFVPPVDGLDQVPFLTNETIFDLTERPEHLIIMGAGPIGCEMAQAHRRLGARVTLVERAQMMGRDEPEAVAVVRARFLADGVELCEGTEIRSVSGRAGDIEITVAQDGQTRTINGSHLLVSSGRRPNIDGLELETAGIAATPRGILVDDRLRTSNKKVFAIGDVAGGYQFTHMASYHAGIVIRNALFWLPAKVDYRAVPWVTYTDPELAHVGKSEAEARELYGEAAKVASWTFDENDRAQAERETEGLVKVIMDPKSRVIGATLVGRHAGELLSLWVLAIANRMKIGKLAGIIVPYPTLSEVSKRAAGHHFTPALFSERTRKIVGFMQKFP
jgi:pyruvate/2-oxoglutarate dehydrogenase complex dihydrolipoamide dehydrogenase (E3) component